jgi:hypothetical protein
MPSIISAGTTTGTALSLTSDTSGELQIRTNNGSTTAMTLTTGGNVGVGTTTPNEKLELSSSSDTYARISAAGNGIAGLKLFAGNNYRSALYYNDAAGTTYLDTSVGTGQALAIGGTPLSFNTNGTERMRIDSSGNVGIGTSGPSTLLHLSSANTAFTATSLTSTSSTQLRVVTVAGTCYFAVDGSGGSSFGTANAAVVWNSINSPLLFATNNLERMRITSAGNVGIGQSSPSCRFDVNDSVSSRLVNFNSTGTNGPGVGLSNSGTDFAYFGSNKWALNGNLTDYGQVAVNNFIFGAGNTERVRITSSGVVCINTTNTYTNARLVVAGSSAPGDIVMPRISASVVQPTTYGTGDLARFSFYEGDASVSFQRFLDIVADGSSGTASGNIRFYTNNSAAAPVQRMIIDGSGGLILAGSTAQKATGTTWSNPSDVRLKDNIQEYKKGLQELMQVSVKTWEYNGKGGTVQGTKGLGVIADEIKEVLPDTVDDYKAKLNDNDAEDTNIKKFDATEITWLLVKSIQELKAELDSVKAELHTLKGA